MRWTVKAASSGPSLQSYRVPTPPCAGGSPAHPLYSACIYLHLGCPLMLPATPNSPVMEVAAMFLVSVERRAFLWLRFRD